MSTTTVAYVYKWHNIHTLAWYVGSRAGVGAHPNDNYISSSKHVTPLIKQNPTDWIKTIIGVGAPKEMRVLEAEILTAMDAKRDPRSWNMHNGDGKFTTLGMSFFKGKKRGPLSAAHKAKMSAAMKGVPKPPFSEEHCKKNCSGETPPCLFHINSVWYFCKYG